MDDVVTMPNTAVKMKETRKKKVKNGMSKITNRVKKRNINGRRMNQPKRKPPTKSDRSYESFKTSAIILATNSLTSDVSRKRNACKEETIRLARRPRVWDGVS